MKKIVYVFFSIIILMACETKESQPMEIPLPEEQEETLPEEPMLEYSTETQQKWESYYDKHMSSFDKENFEKGDEFEIQRSESVVTPIWSEEFDPIYKDFLIYNPDSTMYLDMDSYKWYVDDTGELHIGADQALVLVNIPEKKAETLIVYGPSFWLEDAYFKNDSTIVIFENSTDKIPSYQEINLKTNKTQYYNYKEPLDTSSNYLRDRINRLYKDAM